MSFTAFLLDAATFRLLARSGDLPLVRMLHTASLARAGCAGSTDGETIHFKMSEHLVQSEPRRRHLSSARPDDWPCYCLDGHVFRYQPDHAEIAELRRKSALYRSKLQALAEVTRHVSGARASIAEPEAGGGLVSRLRKEQALKFKASGFDISKMQEFLFVWQYAQVHALEPEAAAEKIILESQFLEAELWKSEGIKLKYYQDITTCGTQEELAFVQAEFYREFYSNAFL